MGSVLPLGVPILKHIGVLLYLTYRLYFWFFSEYGLIATELLFFLSFSCNFIVIVKKKEVRKKGPKKKKKKKKKRPKKKMEWV